MGIHLGTESFSLNQRNCQYQLRVKPDRANWGPFSPVSACISCWTCWTVSRWEAQFCNVLYSDLVN